MWPINPECDALLVLDMSFTEGQEEVLSQVRHAHENTEVTLKWRNATLVIRAGALRAIAGEPNLK